MFLRTLYTGLLFLFFSGSLHAQILDQKVKLPNLTLKDANGKQVSLASLNNKGKPMFISFWATWCKPCIQELQAIYDQQDQHADVGLKVIAVSIDDSRNSSKVGPFVNGRNWDFTVLLDENSDFKRALNVNSVPHSFLVNGNGEIVWQHITYKPGDEAEVFELAAKLAKGLSLK